MDMKEQLFHHEISAQNAVLSQQYLDLMTQATDTSGLMKADLPPCLSRIPANGMSVPPITRRHSSSVYGSSVSKPTPLTPLTETTGYFSNVLGGSLETVNEERFRNRAFSEGASILSCDSSLDQQAQSGTSRYKTELCRPFEENGKCKYGDKCQFAHGKHELRRMVRHPKYKTELCRTYHTSGLCPYGPRCHFIHERIQDEPVVGMQRNVTARMQVPSVPMSVASSIQRQNSLNRPGNLQLIGQQRGSRVNSYSHSPPLDTQCPFFGVNENAVLSPISPMGGQTFNYSKFPLSPKTNNYRRMSENRQASSPILDFTAFGQLSDFAGSDDHVFDSPLTPPDSDRESATGSPPGFAAPAPCPQRLPIFRCLSQSE